MADRTSSPADIRGRRHSIISELIPGSLPTLPEFPDPAPNVQEILTKDIEGCSSSDEDQRSESSLEADEPTSRRKFSVQLAFHPTGVAYGSGFSTVPVPGVDLQVPNPHDVEESYRAEVSLLRDNHILPPKHTRTGWRATAFGRLYDYLFSTEVHPGKGLVVPPEEPSETTPLRLEWAARYDHEIIPPTPAADDVHRQWDEAVAAHLIDTSWQREAKTLVQYSAPMIVTFLLHYSVTVASVLTVGRLGMEELAAVNRKCHPQTVQSRFQASGYDSKM